MMRSPLFLTLAAVVALTACSGGGGSSSTSSPSIPSPASTDSPQTQSENSVDTVNSLGNSAKTIVNYNNTTLAPSAGLGAAGSAQAATGQCNNGVEFFAPDKNNDANSTEEIYFYDSGCTKIARDTVRTYAITGSSESVNRTMTQYSSADPVNPIAQRTSTVSIANATFNQFGYPLYTNGFARSSTNSLNVSNVKTIASDDEMVVMPSSSNVNVYCGDSAGYNATGIAALNETFGWQAATSNGTRTLNADGSVTWAATNSGTAFHGAIGALSIATASANTACPIATPEFTLAGGMSGGSSTIPFTITMNHGMLTSMNVTNATLANGDTLNLASSTSLPPTDPNFITGSVAKNGSTISSFALDGFGDGTLTVASTGKVYTVVDWHVAK